MRSFAAIYIISPVQSSYAGGVSKGLGCSLVLLAAVRWLSIFHIPHVLPGALGEGENIFMSDSIVPGIPSSVLSLAAGVGGGPSESSSHSSCVSVASPVFTNPFRCMVLVSCTYIQVLMVIQKFLTSFTCPFCPSYCLSYRPVSHV